MSSFELHNTKFIVQFWVKHSFNVLLICVKIIWEEDVAVNSPLPWYLPLDKNQFSLASFRVTAFGRFITRNMVRMLKPVLFASNYLIRSICCISNGFKGSTTLQFLFLPKVATKKVEQGIRFSFSILSSLFFCFWWLEWTVALLC